MKRTLAEKKEIVIELHLKGKTPHEIRKETNFRTLMINEFIQEFNLDPNIEYFDVNKLDCWICPSINKY